MVITGTGSRMNYYNEHDPKAAAWLRVLIEEGLIPNGKVDERDIRGVSASDLAGFVQHHFFAGIGGWPLALRLAGWPDDRPVVTGSCPCQPFSVAGKRNGIDDERHVWPAFRWLLSQLRPAIVYGEQVESADGREWLSGVRVDLQALGYRCGAADLPAASVGAPHKRQRLFWGGRLADAGGPEWRRRSESEGEHGTAFHAADGSDDGIRMVQSNSTGRITREPPTARAGYRSSTVAAGGGAGELVQSIGPRLERHAGNGSDGSEPGRDAAEPDRPVAASGAWSDSRVIACRDGKHRRIPANVEPGILGVVDGIPDGVDLSGIAGAFPLAGKTPGRVALLRGYGNAIVPQVAAEFIAAFVESM